METQQTLAPGETVSGQHVAGRPGDTAVKATPEERQAVEVRPMRYVLGLGIGLSALCLVVVYFLV